MHRFFVHVLAKWVSEFRQVYCHLDEIRRHVPLSQYRLHDPITFEISKNDKVILGSFERCIICQCVTRDDWVKFILGFDEKYIYFSGPHIWSYFKCTQIIDIELTALISKSLGSWVHIFSQWVTFKPWLAAPMHLDRKTTWQAVACEQPADIYRKLHAEVFLYFKCNSALLQEMGEASE